MSAAEDGERRVRLWHGGSEQGGVGAGEQDLIQTGQDEGIFAGNDEMACSYDFPPDRSVLTGLAGHGGRPNCSRRAT
jgi:hypothetical protein